MKDLVYISTSRTLLNDEVLLDILKSARKNNSARNVTGVLLYSEGTFIQALEGDEEDVDTIFNRVKQDIRHKNIIVITERAIAERNFSEWFMGFTTADKIVTQGLINTLSKAEQVLNTNDNDATVMMLKAFIESNKLQISY